VPACRAFQGTGRGGQLGFAQQLFINLPLFRGAQAVGHLDDEDAVDEGFVVLVVLEILPFALVGMGHDHAGKRDGPDVFRADVIALLRRGEQRVEHLDRRLEHLDKFENALVRAVEPARIAVGVGIVLREHLELADIDLADQRGDVLVVFVARFGLRDRDLAHARRHQPDHLEFRDVAAELVEPLAAPRADQPGQAAPGIPYLSSIVAPWSSASNRASGLSKIGLISSLALRA
jgi:hypothetical protein